MIREREESQEMSGFQLEVTGGGIRRGEKGEPSEIGSFLLVLIGSMWVRTWGVGIG